MSLYRDMAPNAYSEVIFFVLWYFVCLPATISLVWYAKYAENKHAPFIETMPSQNGRNPAGAKDPPSVPTHESKTWLSLGLLVDLILDSKNMLFGHETAYFIAGSCVQWLEAAGARSIAIPCDSRNVDECFPQINGWGNPSDLLVEAIED